MQLPTKHASLDGIFLLLCLKQRKKKQKKKTNALYLMKRVSCRLCKRNKTLKE